MRLMRKQGYPNVLSLLDHSYPPNDQVVPGLVYIFPSILLQRQCSLELALAIIPNGFSHHLVIGTDAGVRLQDRCAF